MPTDCYIVESILDWLAFLHAKWRSLDTSMDILMPLRNATTAFAATGKAFVRRVLLHAPPLIDTKDVAWFLA